MLAKAQPVNSHTVTQPLRNRKETFTAQNFRTGPTCQFL